jgi:hypothetical protein
MKKLTVFYLLLFSVLVFSSALCADQTRGSIMVAENTE